MEKFFVERITDVSNDLCNYVDIHTDINPDELTRLYEYYNNSKIYIHTNWHAHRIRCMSCIAARLQNKVKIWQCHYKILQYFYEHCHCDCHCSNAQHYGVNHDFFHRDSLNYLIYGSLALLNACLYLKPFTSYDYHELFDPVLDFISPYLDGSKKHIEYIKSEIHSDKQKQEYGKEWDPAYAKTFLRKLKEL